MIRELGELRGKPVLADDKYPPHEVGLGDIQHFGFKYTHVKGYGQISRKEIEEFGVAGAWLISLVETDKFTVQPGSIERAKKIMEHSIQTLLEHTYGEA